MLSDAIIEKANPQPPPNHGLARRVEELGKGKPSPPLCCILTLQLRMDVAAEKSER